jgi:hypothetical protein
VWIKSLFAGRRILVHKCSSPKLISTIPSRASAYLCARPHRCHGLMVVAGRFSGGRPPPSAPEISNALDKLLFSI